MIRLYHGDCLEVMDNLIKQGIQVNAVITDPPYNISRKNNFKNMGRSGIDFGEWDKEFDLFSYMDLVYKLLIPGGSFIVFNDWKNLGGINKYATKLGFMAKDLIRFIKSNPMPRNRDRRYIMDFELAIWFVKGNEKWVFNRQKNTYEIPEFKTSIEKGLHPTQKPVALMKWLIEIHTNKRDTILDPFMGSGTTGVACKNLDRDFIGIEKDDKYFAIAKNRIENHNVQLELF